MRFGVVFPQIEFAMNPEDVKRYAQSAEAAGLDFIEAYDHVIGVNPDRPGGWHGPYTYQSSFLEPFVMYAFMGAVTSKVELATNIIILPQRQTVLAAKQAATLDVLTNGRVRLGVGLGWNDVEYLALNEDFHNRGRRIEEQVEVMRALWSKELVTFDGKWHQIPDAGLKPLPVQRPIPVWFGGRAEAAIKRIARIADGWMTNFRSPEEARPFFQELKDALRESGRDPSQFPIEARLPYGEGKAEVWHKLVQQWREMGVSYFSVLTMGFGFKSPAEHIDANRRFAEAMVKEKG